MIRETIGYLLHRCTKIKAFNHGFSLHAAALKTGLISDTIVSNHVVNLYAKRGNIKHARQVFDEMSEKNLVSWSAMISGYDHTGQPFLALKLFSQMKLVPNEYVFASVISSCATVMALPQGKEIHARSLKYGFASVSFVSNALISMYMKCGQCRYALLVYNVISEPNGVTFNALISGFVENRQPEKGMEFFKAMHQKGFVPDKFTFAGLLGICSSDNDYWIGIQLHCQAIKVNLEDSAFVGNVIITMYSKFKLAEEAGKLFGLIKEKDLISWNTLITACSSCKDYETALKVFKEMIDDCVVKPDDFTFAGVLAACAGLASIRHGKEIHCHLIRIRQYQDVAVGNALVNMYAKCGSIRHAYDVFSRMIRRNLVSWNTIIAGFGNHGLGAIALGHFKKMESMGINPDSVTFVGLLTACNHAGLVEEGQHYFDCMEDIYGISPDIEHFACLIDLLGRAGRLQEAEAYMKKLPFGQDPIILGSLLSACRLHGDVVIGENLAKQLLKLQPVTTSPYVLLSNLYASDEMWGGVAEAWKMLKGSGLKKEPGHSLIDVMGIFEKFTMGDLSHSRVEEIKYILRVLNWAVSELSINPK
ncbi:pentatricopeptide repeat-containing protein At3g09040, mitochondrial-like [Mercurialis annua]|uniref:pentatricopeptide repeat-containing protein At3g09040, mitochondrial-like n=1 Tax=Mercurialis annua TaxID=3986 RepID=UPI00215F475D|nr:pentatricopeptide repeat-containing protein At3g09040, mitochondrial-like [Mercurialis annua]XP_050221769.1 pentatricopeptide repeat-containing protein At3g09040, mitochondrial-like [Mercurialis annua]